MSFWDLIFGTKTEQAIASPKIRLGRFTDSYKSKTQYESWDLALTKFEDSDYLESYKEFLKYLRDDKEDNVRWLEENGGIRFEILQGSKRVSGFADARPIACRRFSKFCPAWFRVVPKKYFHPELEGKL